MRWIGGTSRYLRSQQTGDPIGGTVASEIGFRFSLSRFFRAQTFYAFSHLHRAPSHVLEYPTERCDHMVIKASSADLDQLENAAA